jgi:hypothetical protein
LYEFHHRRSFVISLSAIAVVPGPKRADHSVLSTGQTGGNSRSELPKWKRAGHVIALARDLNVFTSCFTTDFSAVFFSIRHVAQARNMCALSHLLF